MSKDIFNIAQGASGAAPLKTANANNGDRRKKLLQVPELYCEKFDALKASGKTPLLFSAYMIEALREKLERDGAL
ncbi:hypothetical protein ACH54D_20600 [Atlantibacter hermannii]|uniref:hypothetical protein n=1 Tax=Atlantibacter hermannii TaxID=565 RepID=UPI0030E5089E